MNTLPSFLDATDDGATAPASAIAAKKARGSNSGSAALDSIVKSELVNSRGVTYPQFRAGLKPRFAVAWASVLSIWAFLAGASVLLVFVERSVSRTFTWLPLGALGALFIGYALASLTNFFHEATHYLLASKKRTNDLLASLFICPLIGLDIRVYRPIHFAHHRFLGEPEDEENSYFEPLSLRFVLEPLFGLKAARLLLRRRGESAANKPTSGGKRKVPLSALVFYVTVAIGALSQGVWSLGLAWFGGFACVNPLCQSLRQLLEHRRTDARRDADYHQTSHGACTRAFAPGVIASTLGSAGFNRHLLHHWEPQISYTRLGELETYLSDTRARDAVQANRADYARLFVTLLNSKQEDKT